MSQADKKSTHVDNTTAAVTPLSLSANLSYLVLSAIPISVSYIISYFLSSASSASTSSASSSSVVGAFTLNDIIYWNFVIQTVVALLSILGQTEKYYDLTGSITYIVLTSYSYYQATGSSSSNTSTDIYSQYRSVLSLFTIFWAARLGSFLFHRVLSHGSDSRFEKVKKRPLQFFFYWMMQGLWIFLTALPTFWINTLPHTHYDQHTAADKQTFSLVAYIGFIGWFIGFAVETIADYQKFTFRQVKENHGKFISTGVWAYSQHCNYAGEITIWLSIYISLLPILHGSLYLLLFISPAFVYVLLTQMSGIPILQKQGTARWGHLPEYQAYRKNTPLLFPRLF